MWNVCGENVIDQATEYESTTTRTPKVASRPVGPGTGPSPTSIVPNAKSSYPGSNTAAGVAGMHLRFEQLEIFRAMLEDNTNYYNHQEGQMMMIPPQLDTSSQAQAQTQTQTQTQAQWQVQLQEDASSGDGCRYGHPFRALACSSTFDSPTLGGGDDNGGNGGDDNGGVDGDHYIVPVVQSSIDKSRSKSARNREYLVQWRRKKKDEFECLKKQVIDLQNKNTWLQKALMETTAQNSLLRHELANYVKDAEDQ